MIGQDSLLAIGETFLYGFIGASIGWALIVLLYLLRDYVRKVLEDVQGRH